MTLSNMRFLRRWPDYRAVWRWHFYAGLFCIPFLLILSLTGAAYVFKPQIEACTEPPCDHLAITGPRTNPSQQIQAALTAFPNATFQGYELPTSTHAAAQILVQNRDDLMRVYVHPQTSQVLGSVAENNRLMKILVRLHGKLLMGTTGSAIVELAVSWAAVMIISGLYLWWPRQANGLGGILYPRLLRGSRIFWRDLHSVVGIWISVGALFLVLSGLPLTKFWGDYFKAVRRAAGDTVQDAMGASGMRGHMAGTSHGPKDWNEVDRVVAVVEPLHLAPPVVISCGKGPQWLAKSITRNRPQRVDLVLDGRDGSIVSRKDFQQRPLLDRLVGIGMSAHEGQLFGMWNQALSLATACGLILLSLSAIVLWWKRRKQGLLGAPVIAGPTRYSFAFWGFLLCVAICLPMFGASLILVLLIEKTVLCRFPKAQRWLGLTEQQETVQPAFPENANTEAEGIETIT